LHFSFKISIPHPLKTVVLQPFITTSLKPLECCHTSKVRKGFGPQSTIQFLITKLNFGC